MKRETITLAFSGDREAMRRLIERLAPVVHARVARVLIAFGAARRSRDIRQDVEDLTQEVFGELFEDNARVLRSWSPQKGATLEGFVGLVAQRYAITRLRSRKRQTWKELGRTEDELTGAEGTASETPTPEEHVASREVLIEVVQRLRKDLSPKGDMLFRALILEQRSPADVAADTGMSTESLYMWRSRLIRSAREIAKKISLENPRPRRRATGG
ncbi:MAG: sigma-70 family RNA polymerase sigma factor [Myxococcota bacterium]